jgi:hypothetical protein
VRNPLSIVKVLNTFPRLASYDTTNPTLLAGYCRVVRGKKPRQTRLCAQLGISDAQYGCLFMLLVPMVEGRPNFVESDKEPSE